MPTASDSNSNSNFYSKTPTRGEISRAFRNPHITSTDSPYKELKECNHTVTKHLRILDPGYLTTTSIARNISTIIQAEFFGPLTTHLTLKRELPVDLRTNSAYKKGKA